MRLQCRRHQRLTGAHESRLSGWVASSAKFLGRLPIRRCMDLSNFAATSRPGAMAHADRIWRLLLPARCSGSLITAYHGLLTEPMMVFGSGRFRDRLSSYFAVLAVFHCCISAIIAAGLACAGLALMSWASTASGSSMLGYALATPVILLLWLFRRRLLCSSRPPRLAADASTIYMVGMLVIMYALYRSAALSSFTAPLAAAGASGLAIGSIIAMAPFRLWSPWRGDFARRSRARIGLIVVGRS